MYTETGFLKEEVVRRVVLGESRMENLNLNFVRLAGITLLVDTAISLEIDDVNVMSAVSKMELPGG